MSASPAGVTHARGFEASESIEEPIEQLAGILTIDSEPQALNPGVQIKPESSETYSVFSLRKASRRPSAEEARP